ncbi:hypothetical protein HMPREF0476_1492 [Kingella kingae ATCC 23330]|uniref:Uncharacterized protein n=1 Tax=Kingella kingae ATCC 23330 TaxID=887327 RepID=F5S8F9_KINKI|nr:hypothetical protein HMPREF0476_1492 [Kingella kingae ATCC 23330]
MALRRHTHVPAHSPIYRVKKFPSCVKLVYDLDSFKPFITVCKRQTRRKPFT